MHFFSAVSLHLTALYLLKNLSIPAEKPAYCG